MARILGKKFNNKDFEKFDITNYLNEKMLHLSLLGKKPDNIYDVD